MARSREPPLASSREEFQGQASDGWIAPARVAMREVLHAQLPQQERLPGLWKDEKNCKKDSYVDEKGVIAPWPSQSGDAMTSGVAARPTGTAKGLAQTLAQSRQQLAQAKEMGMPEECIRVLECKVLQEEAEMKKAQPLGQKMDQARARLRHSVEAGEKALGERAEGPREFRTSEAGGDTNPYRHAQTPAGILFTSNANSTSQCGPGQIFGGFDRASRKLVEPSGRTTTEQLVQAIQESRAILQTSSVLLSQEGEAAVEIEAGDEQDPELWDQDEDEADGMEGFEETHAPGGPSVDLTQVRKAAAECKSIMPPQQKRTRTEEPEAVAKGNAHFRRFSGYQREPCRIPGTQN